jgi:hypothetical protein
MAVNFDVDFTPLGKLGDIYRKASSESEQRRTLAELGEAFKSGNVDYKQAGGKLIQAGDLQSGLALIKLGEEAAAGQEFSRTLATLGQPGASPPSPGPRASSPVLQQPGARQPVGPVVLDPSGKPAAQDAEGAYGSDAVMMPPGAAAGIDPKHRDMLIRTVFGEAANQPPEGQAAVAAVVKNRMQAGRYGGTDVPGVVQAKGQFEPWGNPEARAGMLGLSPQDPRYQQIGAIVDQVLAGQMPDPTNGATHFFAPKAQAALGRQAPKWAQGQEGQPIGDHTFYAPEGRARVAQAGGGVPTEPQSTVAERTTPLGVSPSAGPAPRGAGTENPASGNIGILAVASANQRLPAPQREIAKTLLTKALDDAKFTDDQKEYYRTYVPQEVAAGRPPKSFEDYKVNYKRAGAITSGETKFEQDMAGINAKRWGKYLDNAELAQTKLVDINQMREISQRIAAGGNSPGAWAGVKDLLGPYAEAAGIPIKDLSDIQAYTSIIQRLAPQNRAAGSGSTSDIEFKGMVKAMPALIQNPVARDVTLNTMEALSRHDLAQGEIAARLASKEITQVQAEKELRALPDPMAGFRKWRQENQKIYGQALNAKPETQTQQPATNALPPELSGKSPTEVMQAAPDGTIFNIQGKRYIKENGKVRPHNG